MIRQPTYYPLASSQVLNCIDRINFQLYLFVTVKGGIAQLGKTMNIKHKAYACYCFYFMTI